VVRPWKLVYTRRRAHSEGLGSAQTLGAFWRVQLQAGDMKTTLQGYEKGISTWCEKRHF
jgi:hypothetical protein